MPSTLRLSEYTEDPIGIIEIVGAGSNYSGTAYDPVGDRVYFVSNNGGPIQEYPSSDISASGLIRTINLSESSPGQGSTAILNNIAAHAGGPGGITTDCEGLCYMGDDGAGGIRLGISIENRSGYLITVITIPAGSSDLYTGDLTREAQYVLGVSGGSPSNSGLEGVCYDTVNEIFYGVGEGEQAGISRKFFKAVRPTNTTTDYDFDDSELVVTEPWDPEVVFQLLGATGSNFDLSGITFHQGTGNVVIASHLGRRLIEVNPVTGTVVDTLMTPVDGDYNQIEGVTFADSERLIVISEHRFAKIYNPPTPYAVPVIVQPPHEEISKGSTFTYTPTTSAGEAGGLWFKEYGPDSMTVDPEDGSISWDTSDAPRGQGFRVTIGYTNPEGEDLKTFILHVDESGTSKIVLLGTTPLGSFPRTTSEFIRIGQEEAGFNPGDTLIVPSGTRFASISSENASENSWQDTQGNNLKSGSASQMTSIMSDGHTIVDSISHDALPRLDEGLEVQANLLSSVPEYIKFSAIEWTGANRQAISYSGTNTIFELCGATDSGYAQDPQNFTEAGGSFASVAAGYLSGTGCVWENCYAFGQFRYGLQFGNTLNNTLISRSIVRPDEYHGDQPRGGITHYSTSNSGCFSNFVIDGDQEHLSPFYKNYAGGLALPATGNETFPFNQTFTCNAVINCEMAPMTADADAATSNLDITDLLILNCTNTITPQTGSTSPLGVRSASVTTGLRWTVSEVSRFDGTTGSSGLILSSSDSSNTMVVTKATFDRIGWDGLSANEVGALAGDKVGASGSSMSDSNVHGFIGTVSLNNFPVTTDITALDPRTNGLSYPVRMEEGSPLGLDGQGADLTVWANPSNVLPGDAGWLTKTSQWSWPHPEEALIASRMKTYSKSGLPVRNATVGVNPTDFTGTITGDRGFCTDEESFSEYVWGQFGVTIPPLRVAAKATAGGEVTFWVGKYRSDRGRTVTKFNIYNKTDTTTPIGSFTGLTGKLSAQDAGAETYVVRAVDPTKATAWDGNEGGESGNSRDLPVTVTEFVLPAVNTIADGGLPGPNTFPIFPIPDKTPGAGPRLVVFCAQFETPGGAAITAVSVGGQPATFVHTTLNENGATFSTLLAYIKEDDIANITSTTMSYTGASPGGSSGFLQAVVVENTDQTTPYVNTDQVGYDSYTQNSTDDATFTLDPVSKGLALAFVATSNGNISPDMNGNAGWSQQGSNVVNGSNNSGYIATKTYGDADEAPVSTTLKTGVAGGKVAVSSLMINSGAPVASDNIVDEFTFVDQTGVSPSTLTESNELTITGVDVDVDLSIINGEYSKNSGAWTTAAGTITGGDKLKVRVTSSATGDNVVSALVTIAQYTDFWNVTTVGVAPDSTPDAFSFTNVSGAEVSTATESNAVTIFDINQLVDISVSGDAGAEYKINSGPFTSVAGTGTVSNGDQITVRVTSSSSFLTATSVTLTVGGVSDTFSVTTSGAPDTTPDAFSFTDQVDVAVSTMITSNTLTITGLTGAATTTVSAGEWSKNGGAFTTAPGTIENDDTIQLRLPSSALNSTASSIVVDIGGVSDTWTITTVAPAADTVPDAFSFTDQSGLDLYIPVESDPITVTGISAASPIFVTDGEYSINGGAYVSAAGSVNNNDTVTLRMVTSQSNSSAESTTLDIGGVTDVWSVTTAAAGSDTTPDAFSFTDQVSVGLNAVVESEIIEISGIDASTSIFVTSGEWKKSGGAYQASSGTVVNGDTIQLRQTASSSNSTMVSMTVNVGGVSDQWDVTTLAVVSDTTPDAFDFTNQTNVALFSAIESNTITVAGVNAPSAIFTNKGEYSVNGAAYRSDPSTVSNGDTVKLRVLSSATNTSAVNTTVSIGSVLDVWTITTLAASDDTTPDAFSFTDQSSVAVSTLITSDQITIAGINTASSISVTGGEYRLDGGAYTTLAGTVTNGQTVQLRLTSSASNSATSVVTLTIGGINDAWNVTTLAFSPDTTPNIFSFVDQPSVTIGTAIESNTITISGINAATPISIVGGEFSINGGAYDNTPSTVADTDTVRLKVTSSASNSTQKDVIVSIGGISDTWEVTTDAGVSDTVPDAFVLNDVTDVKINTQIESNEITVEGINAPSSISVGTGGEYSINDGSYTSIAGVVVDGDKVKVRATSSATNLGLVTIRLTIGTIFNDWSITSIAYRSATGTFIDADDNPLATTTFNWWLFNDNAIIDFGSATTDSSGVFTVGNLASAIGTHKYLGLDPANNSIGGFLPITVTE